MIEGQSIIEQMDDLKARVETLERVYADADGAQPDEETAAVPVHDRLTNVETFLQRQFGKHNFDVADTGQAGLPAPAKANC